MTTILLIFLTLSILINITFIFYARWLLKSLSLTDENLQIIYDNLDDFSAHVETVHESEMFYGDETLKLLIEHSKKITDSINDYKDILLPPDQGDEDQGGVVEDGGTI